MAEIYVRMRSRSAHSRAERACCCVPKDIASLHATSTSTQASTREHTSPHAPWVALQQRMTGCQRSCGVQTANQELGAAKKTGNGRSVEKSSRIFWPSWPITSGSALCENRYIFLLQIFISDISTKLETENNPFPGWRAGAAATASGRSTLMVTSVRDGAQWDGSCCALKLVKLAAGDFDAELALGSTHLDEQPSWRIASSSPIASENNKSTSGVLSATTNRSVRSMAKLKALGWVGCVEPPNRIACMSTKIISHGRLCVTYAHGSKHADAPCILVPAECAATDDDGVVVRCPCAEFLSSRPRLVKTPVSNSLGRLL